MPDILVNVAGASVFPSSTYANVGTSPDGRLISEKNLSRLNKLTVNNHFVWLKLNALGEPDAEYNFYTDVSSYNTIKPGICIIDGRTIEVISSTSITQGISQLPANIVTSYYLAIRMDIQLAAEGNVDNPSSFYNALSFEFTPTILKDTSTVKRLYLYKYNITAGPTVIGVEDIRNFCPFDINSIIDTATNQKLSDYLSFIKTNIRGLGVSDSFFDTSSGKHISIESTNGVYDRLHYVFNIGASKPFINDKIKSGDDEFYELGDLVALNSDKMLNRNVLPPAHESTKGVVFVDSSRVIDSSASTFNPASSVQTLFIVNGEIYTTAEVNQNAFSYIQTQSSGVNGTQVRAVNKMDTLIFNAQSNLVITSQQTTTQRKLNLAVSNTPVFTSMTVGPANIRQATSDPNSGILINTPVTVTSLKSTGNTEVSGNLSVTGTTSLSSVSCDNVTAVGDITANNVWCAVYNDVAENFEVDSEHEFEPGDVLARNMDTGIYELAKWETRKLVVGAVSDSYGFLLGGDDKSKQYKPVALCGRVKVKVVGTVMPGDLLTVSWIPGVAKKVSQYESGTVIGKSLEQKDSTGTEKITMLVISM